MNLDFLNLQKTFNNQMDFLLGSSALATKCQFNFGINKKNICPNCIYDPNLKKSSNQYKNGGPVPFGAGKICPYCNGAGSYGEIVSSEAYLTILWNYKQWINPPINIANSDGMIQTISNKNLLSDIRRCKDITVLINNNIENPTFTLYGEPNFSGLGDNNYLVCIWRKV